MRLAILLAAGAMLAGCVTTGPRGMPPGYVSLESSGDVRLEAVSPAGNRVRVRRHENPTGGTLRFWREAIERELTAGRGYELVESRDVSGHGGRSGREMLFRAERPEGSYLYLVRVRVEGRDVTVTEAGGEEDALRADLDALRAALR